MSTENLLVELGTEELPPKALRDLSDAFTNAIVQGLAERELQHGTVQSYATPRRLAVSIADLQLRAEDKEVEVFGPPADRARDDDGQWTPAAEGFARKQGVSPDQLETADTDKGERLVFRSVAAGVETAACMEEIVRNSVRALPIPKRMRWGAGRAEFVRPVHWLVMMLGGDVIEADVLGLHSGNTTQGHRFHSSGEIALGSASDYEDTLKSAMVLADFDQRRSLIQKQVQEQAEQLNAEAVIDPALLDEVTALVEWPVALTGSFESRFLEVPPEALVASMKEHQKYFHLVDSNRDLLPHFITISNIESKDPAQVIDGNERVIRPRLADADFFYRSDQETPLGDRVERLESIVFQQKLGTLGDKTRRLMSLAAELAAQLGADPDLAQRAGELSKTDLLTSMVGEFPDMQGIAGRYYALHDNEDPLVADALQQQYWPRFSGDVLPDNPVATCLALADRLDTLCGIFGIGQQPTGSKDPFALRRASLGVLRMLVEGSLPLDLGQCLEIAINQYPAGVLEADTREQVLGYMLERFRAWYEEEDIAPEVFRSVSAKNLTVPLDIHQRVHAVNSFSSLPQAQALAAANKRVSNILAKQGSEFKDSGVSEDLLTLPAEQSLHSELERLRGNVGELIAGGDYTEALTTLAELQPAVDQFFDDVMVMADEEELRNNRLSLVKQLRDQFLQVADISHLVV